MNRKTPKTANSLPSTLTVTPPQAARSGRTPLPGSRRSRRGRPGRDGRLQTRPLGPHPVQVGAVLLVADRPNAEGHPVVVDPAQLGTVPDEGPRLGDGHLKLVDPARDHVALEDERGHPERVDDVG